MTDLKPYQTQQEVLSAEDYKRIVEDRNEPKIMWLVILGLLCLILFIGGAMYWAYKARIDGAVFADASLVVEGNRKTVQHLDGGIVRAIAVADGEAVVAGQTLLTLDSSEIDVTVDVLSSQIGELRVRRARLLAQLNEAEVFSLADIADLHGIVAEKHWRAAYQTQKDLFEKERRARLTEQDILAQRIFSLRQEIGGLQEQRDSNARQSKISQDELAGLEALFNKGLVTGNRVSAINVEIERLRGADASLKTAQARAENEIGQLQLTGISQKRLRAEAITTELAGIEARLAEIGPQLSGARDRLSRVEITAPVSGRIVNLAVFTNGGVIRPGEAILDIVPDGENLIVEARVKTTDIETLRIGQSARVQLTAFEQDDIPEATGRIAQISADSLQDDRTGDDYFVVNVAMDATQSPRVAALDLVPGMPVGLFINTGERTAINYLTAPLRERLRRTFID